ncbi:PcfJ domain-containing protein [Vibrio crassostreae]|uniref:PcfJ domain-containing protein n=1 Tax=Vibrio crassostreae TaxID=246167 RepID=UPI001B315855|nr:PcfJ domain-containing protein [Vibrio crassostreae]
MSVISTIEKYLNKHRETLLSEGGSTHAVDNFLPIVKRSQLQTKKFETEGFHMSVTFEPEVYKFETRNIDNPDYNGTVSGPISYLIRRKSDNQVITGFLRDAGAATPPRRNLFDESHYGEKSHFDKINDSNLLSHLRRDKLLKAFIDDGVAIDDISVDPNLRPTSVNTMTPHLKMFSPVDVYSSVELSARGLEGNSYLTFERWADRRETAPDESQFINLAVKSAQRSVEFYEKNNLIDLDDLDSFKAEMVDALNDELEHQTFNALFEEMRHDLPEEITVEHLVGNKYTQSELNFVRSKPEDPSADSSKYRLQYINQLRDMFGVEDANGFNQVLKNRLKNVGLYTTDNSMGVEWSLHTMLMRNHGLYHGGHNSREIIKERLDAISEGKFPSKEFIQDARIDGVNKKTFGNFVKLANADMLYNQSFKDMVSLTTLPKEVFNADMYLEGGDKTTTEARERHRVLSEMLKNLAPQFINYAPKLTQARKAFADDPSPENKTALKEMSAKYKWLSQGGDVEGNYNKLMDNLKGDTLRDFGAILGSYMQAVTNRIADEKATDADEVFTVTLDEGQMDVVSIEVSTLHDQHLEEIESDTRDDSAKYVAYEGAITFITENKLDKDLVLSGLEREQSKSEFDFLHGGSDHDVIAQNLMEHYPDRYDELKEMLDDVVSMADNHYEYFDIREMYEEPSEIDGDDVLKSIRGKEHDFRHVLELNKQAHVTQSQNQKVLAEYGRGDDFSWTPLYEGNHTLENGLMMTVIDTKERLLDEAITQKHCVFSYLQRAMCGESIILSVTDQGRRVATVELTHDDFEDFSVEQCYGEHNNSVDASISDAVETFVEQLNEDPDELGIELPEEITSNIDISDAESNPSGYASMLSQVPFKTDAAHRALFILEDMTPDSFNVEEFLCDNMWGELYYSSDFRKEIDHIKSIVDDFKEEGVTPHDVIELKTIQGKNFKPEEIRETLKSRFEEPADDFLNKINANIEQSAPNAPPRERQQNRPRPAM